MSQLLIIHRNQEPFVPEWRKEVELTSHFLGNIPELGKHHLHIDKPEIFEKIRNYTECLKKHNDNITKFRYLLDAVIKNKFIENKLMQDKDNFHVECFRSTIDLQLVTVIRGHIEKHESLEKLKESLKVNVSRNQHGELWLKNSRIGSGDEMDIGNIEKIINELPSNKIILKGLIDLYQNAKDIESESLKLQNEIGEIIGSINILQYKTLTTCCPTQDTSIWNDPKQSSE